MRNNSSEQKASGTETVVERQVRGGLQALPDVPGLVVAAMAMPIMYVLARRKLDVARQLRSRAMRADAIESITCGWLSLVVVVGLVAHLLLAAWWIDAVTSLGIVWFVLKEAREAWRGEDCCSHAC